MIPLLGCLSDPMCVVVVSLLCMIRSRIIVIRCVIIGIASLSLSVFGFVLHCLPNIVVSVSPLLMSCMLAPFAFSMCSVWI